MPDPAFDKSAGTTPSEKYLAKLCDQTFLKLWSYPNVYRDQGRKDNKGDGKELCDLLVVFGNDIIIFSDKSCCFPNTGNEELDWSRWYKKSVTKSAEQVWGAERWLLDFPDKVFIDPKCQVKLPIRLPNHDVAVVHRIIVALGASARCRGAVGGYGGLYLTNSQDFPSAPYLVNTTNFLKGFVHVFDDVSLDIVLGELDTVSDFVSYLAKKQNLFCSDKQVMAPGEQELLGLYLGNVNQAEEHDFVFPKDVHYYVLTEGFWSKLQSNPQYLAKKRRDELSYLWDASIENHAFHLVRNTLIKSKDTGFAEVEQILRIMAAEPRLKRRMLGRSIKEVIDKTRDSSRTARVSLSGADPTICYIYLCISVSQDIDYERHREIRKGLLYLYCQIAQLEFPAVQSFIGLAFDRPSDAGGSEDLMMYRRAELSSDEITELRAKQQQLNILIDAKSNLMRFNEPEYPSIAVSSAVSRETSTKHKNTKKSKSKKMRKAQKAARRLSRSR